MESDNPLWGRLYFVILIMAIISSMKTRWNTSMKQHKKKSGETRGAVIVYGPDERIQNTVINSKDWNNYRNILYVLFPT